MRRTEASARAIERASSDPTAAKPANEAERSAKGAGGAKGRDQGECGPAKHDPDAEPDESDTGAGAHTTNCKGKKERFTALLHHIDPDLLEAEFFALKKHAAPGPDGVTWRDYEQDLKANLEDLHARVHRGAYRPQPSRRVYIPKPDGRQRPLAIAALEDKIVQRATAVVLNAIYEEDFLGFSYGFRPGRSAHDAMDALAVGIEHRKVNFIVDADIRSFFDTVDQQWLTRFVEHRIGDPRIIRLIQKWLKAGVLEEGTVRVGDQGTAQGAVISPLLANSTCTMPSICGLNAIDGARPRAT
ncbi:retron-type reverse transcriptase [Bradyrhizobium sp. LM2.7]